QCAHELMRAILRFGHDTADGFRCEQAHNPTSLAGSEFSHPKIKKFRRAGGTILPMLPVREEELEDRQYHQDLATVRERILGFVLRRLVPHRADFAQAEDIAQSCVIVLWEHYPDKRELAEMVRIAIGTARHKMAQFQRDREKMPDISESAADRLEFRIGTNPHSGERLFERTAARQETDRLLLAMVKLPERCRELM